MADGDQYPLLRLGTPRELARKKVTPKFPPPPTRNVVAHGSALLAGTEAARQRVASAVAVSRDLATDVPYVRIQPELKHVVSDADLARLGLVPVMHRHDHVIAAYATDNQFGALRKKVGEYQRQTAKHDMLSRIASLGPWTRADRSSPKITELTIKRDESYTVDLMLLPMDGARVVPHARNAVTRFVQAQGGRVLDQMRSTRFEALRVRLGGQSLELLLDYRDDVALVDLPPKAHVSVPAILSFSIDVVPEAMPPGDSAPAVCIIDSGIVEGHPMLADTIASARSKAYPATLGQPVPAAGTQAARHGTGVAGVTLYGDIARCVTSKTFEPAASLVNARILDDDLDLDPDRMPFVREIVEDLTGICRIFNLSFGLEPSTTALSPYASDLDALAREGDALFLVAAGNLHPHLNYPTHSSAGRRPTPGYAFRPPAPSSRMGSCSRTPKAPASQRRRSPISPRASWARCQTPRPTWSARCS